MSDLYSIEAKWVLSPENQTLRDKQIIIENKKITYIGKYDSSRLAHGVEHIKYDKGLVCPPFINAHTHIPETLIRGLIDDVDLNEWLFNHVWKVEPKMNENDARIGTQLGVAEMFRSGTIGFVDQYFFSDAIAKVVYESGAKASLGPSIFDNNPEFKTSEESFQNNIKVLERWHKKDNRVFIGFGPHAPYTVDEEMFLKIYEQAEKYDTFIHTHLHETKKEVDDAVSKNNMSSIKSFDKLGILDRVYAAHCVFLDEIDRKLLLKNDVSILHNLQSNLKIGSGIAPIPEYIDLGINIALGTDGNASNNNLDMLEEVRLTALIHKGIHQNPKLIDARTALNMGTRNASKLFPKGVYSGIIDIDQPADLVIIDMNSINMTPVINPLSNWIFSSNSRDVVFTMSDGLIVYQDNELKTLDEAKIIDGAQESTNRMMNEANYEANEFK